MNFTDWPKHTNGERAAKQKLGLGVLSVLCRLLKKYRRRNIELILLEHSVMHLCCSAFLTCFTYWNFTCKHQTKMAELVKKKSNVAVKCSAVGCLNKQENGSHVSFFKFPCDRARSV